MVLLLLALASAPAPQIEIYTRAPGVHARFERKPAPIKRVLVDPGARGEVRVLKDPQYAGKSRTWRGTSLRSLVLGYPHAKGSDLVLFHFTDGMTIPWPHTAAALDELDAFVATAWKRRDGKWDRSFKPALRQDNFFNDPTPIRFEGNKVVSEDGHVPALKGADLNPWRHVGSLVGIEFAERSAWEAQFAFTEKQAPNGASAARGRAVFQQRCVYCHGLRDVGGDLGPDLARPLNVTEYREPNDIRLKIKVHRMDAWGTGLRMPPQEDVRDDEVEALIDYFVAIGKERTRSPSYRP